MSIESALIFHGSIESAEVIEDVMKELVCSNGHKVKVVNGMAFTEKGMSVVASENICPICNTPLQ